MVRGRGATCHAAACSGCGWTSVEPNVAAWSATPIRARPTAASGSYRASAPGVGRWPPGKAARRRPHPGRRRPPHAQHRWLADRRGSGARLGSPFGCPTRSPRASCRRCEATTSRPTPSATTATPAVYSTSRPPQRQWTLWRHVGTGLVARGERCRTSHPAGDGWHRRHGPGPACCAWTYGHRPDLKGSSCATPSSPSTS
jgi:hypothetical protein